MRAKELRSLSEEELQEKLDTFRKSLFDLNLQRKYGKIEKPHLFREYKKNIAKILTILKEKRNEK